MCLRKCFYPSTPSHHHYAVIMLVRFAVTVCMGYLMEFQYFMLFQAQSAQVAEIWLWEVGTWKAVGRLQSHNLTVTQMEFSRDNAFLLSVSRDRHLSVFSIRKTGKPFFYVFLLKLLLYICLFNHAVSLCYPLCNSRGRSRAPSGCKA